MLPQQQQALLWHLVAACGFRTASHTLPRGSLATPAPTHACTAAPPHPWLQGGEEGAEGEQGGEGEEDQGTEGAGSEDGDEVRGRAHGSAAARLLAAAQAPAGQRRRGWQPPAAA